MLGGRMWMLHSSIARKLLFSWRGLPLRVLRARLLVMVVVVVRQSVDHRRLIYRCRSLGLCRRRGESPRMGRAPGGTRRLCSPELDLQPGLARLLIRRPGVRVAVRSRRRCGCRLLTGIQARAAAAAGLCAPLPFALRCPASDELRYIQDFEQPPMLQRARQSGLWTCPRA